MTLWIILKGPLTKMISNGMKTRHHAAYKIVIFCKI